MSSHDHLRKKINGEPEVRGNSLPCSEETPQSYHSENVDTGNDVIKGQPQFPNYATFPAKDSPGSLPISPKLKSAKGETDEIRDEAGVQKWPMFLINVSLILIKCASRFYSLVVDQYIYQESARQLVGNGTLKTSSDPCINDSSINSTMSSLVSQVESMTSSRLLYLDLTSYGISVISNIILGAYSNALNRKLQIVIPTLGYFLRHAFLPVVIMWNLNLNWLYLGYTIDGVLGSAPGILLGSYLYTTDITPRNRKRTLGVAIVEGTQGMVTAALNIATGDLIEAVGCLTPSLISASFAFLSFSVVLFLPNRKPRLDVDRESSKWSPKQAWNSLVQPFRDVHGEGVGKMLKISCVSFSALTMTMIGISRVQDLYVMNIPFCWSSVMIGWFKFGSEFGSHTFAVFAVAAFHGCFPGMTLGIWGAMSLIASALMYTFAKRDYQLYIVPALIIGKVLPAALIRGEGSRLLDSNQQGALFASFAVVEALSFAMGSLALYVYQSTLSIYPRPAFLMCAGIATILAVLLIWFQVLWRRHTRQKVLYQPINDASNDKLETNPKAHTPSINA